MRIVSLLPAATEILYAIGAGDDVVGVTHECDYPPDAAKKPALIRPRVDAQADPGELDRQVRELVERGESIYAVDAELLERLAPDLIVTQDLCHVCAASPEDLATALSRLPPARTPRVVTFTPHALTDIWQGIRQIGAAAGQEHKSLEFAAQLEREVAAIASQTARMADRPRVLCLEWFDPLFVGGHWVPEMVRLAGGIDLFGREGEASFTVEWRDVLAAKPDVVILMSCGYTAARNAERWRQVRLPPEWNQMPAVRSGRVFAIDANAYASRSGPRLAEGIALFAGLFHPELVARAWPSRACLGIQSLHKGADSPDRYE